MSQANHDGEFLIRQHGLEKAETEARERWDTACSGDDETYSNWCYAVLSYILGYKDAMRAVNRVLGQL